MQGGGGQLFLSQGGTLNLKSLQNMKVVSLAPAATTTANKTNNADNNNKNATNVNN